MRTRIAALTVALVAALALGVGAALAGPQDSGPSAMHDRVHSSEQMRAMHTEMPADAQAGCDAMHARMPAAMDRRYGQSGMDAMHGRAGRHDRAREG